MNANMPEVPLLSTNHQPEHYASVEVCARNAITGEPLLKAYKLKTSCISRPPTLYLYL